MVLCNYIKLKKWGRLKMLRTMEMNQRWFDTYPEMETILSLIDKVIVPELGGGLHESTYLYALRELLFAHKTGIKFNYMSEMKITLGGRYIFTQEIPLLVNSNGNEIGLIITAGKDIMPPTIQYATRILKFSNCRAVLIVNIDWFSKITYDWGSLEVR